MPPTPPLKLTLLTGGTYTDAMPEATPLEELETLRAAALDELVAISDEAGLDTWRIAYLGRSGKLTQVLRSVSTLPAEERPVLGAAGNKAKLALEAQFDARRTQISNVRLNALADDNIYLRGDRFLYLRNAELWSDARTPYSKEPATRSTTPDTSAHQRVTTTRSLSGSQTTEFPPAPDAAKVASLAASP